MSEILLWEVKKVCLENGLFEVYSLQAEGAHLLEMSENHYNDCGLRNRAYKGLKDS